MKKASVILVMAVLMLVSFQSCGFNTEELVGTKWEVNLSGQKLIYDFQANNVLKTYGESTPEAFIEYKWVGDGNKITLTVNGQEVTYDVEVDGETMKWTVNGVKQTALVFTKVK